METIVPAQFANHPDLTNGMYRPPIPGDDTLLSDILTHIAQHGFPLATEWYEPTESGSLRKQCVELVWRNRDGDELLRSSVFGIRNTPNVDYVELRKIGPTGLTLPAYPGLRLRHPKGASPVLAFWEGHPHNVARSASGPGVLYYRAKAGAEERFSVDQEFEEIRDAWTDRPSQTGVIRCFRFCWSQVGSASSGPLGLAGSQQYAYCWKDVSKVDGNARPSQLA